MNLDQSQNLLDTLQSGLRKLDLELSQTTQETIIKYIMLLYKWNQTHNLTAIRDPESILIRHVFDSLATVPFIIGPDVLDFGTGAGIPGILLALALPKCKFVLLDSIHKKTFFLEHVKLTLNIENVDVVTKRVEYFHFAQGFTTIITRATADADVVLEQTKHVSGKNGQVLLMKGKYPEQELAKITKAVATHRLEVPYLNEERHLVKILN